MKTEQMIFRLYPPGYTNNPISDMQKLLDNGWKVKHITPTKTDNTGGIIHDYILEREVEE